MNHAIKWAAELTHVREVSLRGVADLEFWKRQLEQRGLIPADCDGRAQVLIIAGDARFRGVRFREMSVAVLVEPIEEGSGEAAAYLLRAFNSCRFFAFCERVFFSTPYRHADVRVAASFPPEIEVNRHGESLLRASMCCKGEAHSREPSRRGENGWEGAVFLPESARRKIDERRLFYSRIHGDTHTYPFLAAADSLTIRSVHDDDALTGLVESNFVAREWDIRADATHAKSKTYAEDRMRSSSGGGRRRA